MDKVGWIPPPPRTPSGRALRLIFAYTGMQSVLRWIGIFFLIMGCGIGVPFMRGVPEDLAIIRDRLVVEGQVIGTRTVHNVEINEENPVVISFRYTVGEKGYTAESATLDDSWASALATRGRVPVEVSGSNPQLARVQGTTRNWAGMGWSGLFFLLFPLIGLAMWLGAVRSNRRERMAYRYGTATLGRVTFAGEDTSVEINDQHPYKVAWEFVVAGKSYAGALSSMKEEDLEPLSEQAQLPVLYMARDPRINTVWIP